MEKVGKMDMGDKSNILSRISSHLDTRSRILIAAIIALSIFLALVAPAFATIFNLQILLLSMSVLSILAVGELIVMAAGEIDISLESVINFTSIVVLLPIFWANVPWYIAVLVGIASGAGWGAVNGFITIKLKIPSFLTTLATLMFIQGLAYILTEYRSWSLPRGTIDPIFAGKIVGIIDTGVFWMIGAVIVVYIILAKTRFGRRVYAVGGNTTGAEMIGVPVKKTKFLSFVIMGVLVALATLINMSRARYASHQIGYGYLLPTIGAPILGGAALTGGLGSVPKTLIGAFFLTLITNGAYVIGLQPADTYILLGGFIILVLSVEKLRIRRVRRESKIVKKEEPSLKLKPTKRSTKKYLLVTLVVLLFVGMTYDFAMHKPYPELQLTMQLDPANPRAIMLHVIDGFTDAETVEFNVYPKGAPENPQWTILTHYVIEPGADIPIKSDCVPGTTYIVKIRHIGTKHLYLDTEITVPS